MSTSLLTQVKESTDHLAAAKKKLSRIEPGASECRRICDAYRNVLELSMASNPNYELMTEIEFLATGIEAGIRLCRKEIEGAEKALARAAEDAFLFEIAEDPNELPTMVARAESHTRQAEQSAKRALAALDVVDSTVGDFMKQKPVL